MTLAGRTLDLERWVVSLALVPACAYFLWVDFGARGWAGVPWMLFHSMDLIVHEAGHFFFRFFGRTLEIAGGSILQVLLPAIVAWSALTWGSRVGFQLGAFWTGQSLIDVSVYAADAKARSLPLLGNLSRESHDWYNLLAPIGWLDHAEAVGVAFVIAALAVWALALSAPKWTA
ncbi:hypothetical protein [Rubricoccus marinus]|uniref:Uncharacterized protein n=1 Tax=Rubricoccus marinus TaxID=716817 RepID=A0A259U023_9BACT|nr:hypothetical protein [Rubricoccus marinus]OZC03197.1 hypothetical protein BSZ36_09555 [Rubricoccus marinus]